MSVTIEQPPRRGRRAGSSNTRDEILAAAKKSFATDGFAATTIRKIAKDAGVDPALVMQFYGTKEVLFAASLAVSADALTRMSEAFEGPVEGLGWRVTRAFLTLWEQKSGDGEALMAMQRAAMSSEVAAAQLRDFVQYRIVEVFSPKLHARSDAALRAGLATSMLVGVIVSRNIVRIPLIAEVEQEAVIELLGASIQTILVG
ncbi:transcriptional regulator, TetR family [Duganella sp. CF517]|uniref:TetR/AcrR family transcriptional regulator n=1 Tax=Duganella sp. CF517 TaxID=1881038 RepID=UPI0008CC111E|nr:TetR family transcriptional regulator [Duganella sp. CF517]SEO09310.1 transcriptional regulator, TetR family [Duganella sp. CF517]